MSLNEARRQELLTELEQFRDGLVTYKELVVAKKRGNLVKEREEEFQTLSLELQRKYGGLREAIEEYGGPAEVLLLGGQAEYEAFSSAFNYTPFHAAALVMVMDRAITVVNMAIGNLESVPASSAGVPDTHVAQPPKAFIAHGGESAARGKLCQFLDALKVIAVIAEKEASEGRSLNQHIDWCIEQSDCAIILATKGDIDGRTGDWIPRGNILIEIGKVQERFPQRTVYLLEEGATFPTGVSEKVWERFTHECMDKAFTKVAKELVAFGLIRAMKG